MWADQAIEVQGIVGAQREGDACVAVGREA